MAEPSKSTLKSLGAVSGNRCAFPSCLAPIYDTEHGKLVGQVAHIKAESPLGPRFEKDQSDDDRHGLDNLIFLCAPHHLVIDDPSNLSEYTVDAFVKMKRQHETNARNTILTEVVIERLVMSAFEAVTGRVPPAWAWTRYRDDIADRIRKTPEAIAAFKKNGEDAGADWEQLKWEEAAAKYRQKIKALYGMTRVIGKPEPISLEGVFTDVFILDKPTAYQRYDIKKLRHDVAANKPTGRRMAGLNLVQDRTRLFILGKPGAGKTTFLKYVALQSTTGMFNKIPIFVGLKEWADSGLDLTSFIVKQFAICDFPNAWPFVEYILDENRAIVMFDGLDEVRQEQDNRSRTISDIRDFTNKYFGCKCLITCRIAATDYTFEHFEYVEIADFTDEQIFAYARKWFGDDEDKYKAFTEGITKPENRGLYEIASVPILLTLLCLSFNSSLEFPHRRVEVYEEALEALLKTWDATRNIKRDEIYRDLTYTRKRQLLSRLAAITFQENKYFVSQAELANHIVTFLRRLPGAEVTAEIDGNSVLKSHRSTPRCFVRTCSTHLLLLPLNISRIFRCQGRG